MDKLHSALPREITSPFTREIISELHSKACNNLVSRSRPFPFFTWRWERVWPTAIELPVLAVTWMVFGNFMLWMSVTFVKEL